MLCPVCDGITLREVEKNGVLIDVCPSCKGVWLDRGELDKLMHDVHATHQEYEELQSYVHNIHAKGLPVKTISHSPYPPNSYRSSISKGYLDSYKSKYYGYDKYGRPYKKKKKTVFSILEDLFD